MIDQPLAPCEDVCGWSALAPGLAAFGRLAGHRRVASAVVGGGFTGLAAARRLAELCPEAAVAILEGKRIAGGATARNSGFAVANESPGHARLDTAQGRARYHALNRIDHAGVAELKRLVAAHAIACQWEDTGSIHAAHDPVHFAKLRAHLAAFESLGVDARLIEGAALARRLGTAHYGLGLETRGGGLVQPAMLAEGLAGSLPDNVTLHENSPVTAVIRTTAGWLLETPGGTVLADRVIVAVNAFFPRLGLKNFHLFPLALSASLTRPLSAAEDAEIGQPPSWGVLSPRSLGATMRLTQDRRVLIRNTAEYRPAGLDRKRLQARRAVHAAGLRRRFGFLGEGDIDFTWSGAICISRNGNPVFEEAQPGLFLCGGYNASGVSRGTIMGRLVAELALGGQSGLISDALSLARPNLLPPRPFLDVGLTWRLAAERRAASGEA